MYLTPFVVIFTVWRGTDRSNSRMMTRTDEVNIARCLVVRSGDEVNKNNLGPTNGALVLCT